MTFSLCVISMPHALANVATRPGERDVHDGRPFAIVDKRHATLSVHAADGRLLGRTAALLGSAPGDAEPLSARGKAPDALQPHERVTPAGRFESVPGRNLTGERVVWFNYDANLAIHRLRPTASRERRTQRLASTDPRELRITLGCVVVDPVFFDEVVLPALGNGRALVYILPERDAIVVAGSAGSAGSPRAAAAP